jgi:hypothetical protein
VYSVPGAARRGNVKAGPAVYVFVPVSTHLVAQLTIHLPVTVFGHVACTVTCRFLLREQPRWVAGSTLAIRRGVTASPAG